MWLPWTSELIHATTLHRLKMQRSLMAAWKGSHHPLQAAAEVTGKKRKEKLHISWTGVATFEVKAQSHQLSLMSQQCIIYLLYSEFDLRCTDLAQSGLEVLQLKSWVSLLLFLCTEEPLKRRYSPALWEKKPLLILHKCNSNYYFSFSYVNQALPGTRPGAFVVD